VPVGANQNRFRSQVAVGHAVPVEVFKRQNELSDDKSGQINGKSLFPGQPRGQIATGAEVEDHVELVVRLEGVV
jgi:hypothetical protein